MKITADFHVHSCHSVDSIITFPRLVENCRKSGVDVVAIMDHDSIEGALRFKELSEEARENGEWAPRVIVGEEIRSAKGEICGLFMKEHVEPRQSPRDTMLQIRAQGGLVYVPHPFDLLKLKRLRARDLIELESLIDIIEVFNGKPRFPLANVLARRFVGNDGFITAGGSDAHDPTRVGMVRVVLDDFDSPHTLLQSLKSASVQGKMYSPLSSAYKRFVIRKKLIESDESN